MQCINLFGFIYPVCRPGQGRSNSLRHDRKRNLSTKHCTFSARFLNSELILVNQFKPVFRFVLMFFPVKHHPCIGVAYQPQLNKQDLTQQRPKKFYSCTKSIHFIVKCSSPVRLYLKRSVFVHQKLLEHMIQILNTPGSS